MLHRKERAESFIQQQLTLLLRERVRDPRISALTVTEVELTQDRRFARIYVASFEGEEALQEGLKGLESAKGLLRRELAQRLSWRFTPQLAFRPDRSWQYGEHMDQLFDQIARDEITDEEPAQEPDADKSAESDESE
jgi:ribosome-binding factor A